MMMAKWIYGNPTACSGQNNSKWTKTNGITMAS